MYDNQYFVTSKQLTKNPGLKEMMLGDLYIYAHPSLNTSVARHEDVEICVLGYVIDPMVPEAGNDQIIERLARSCRTKDDLFKGVQPLSGRFVILYKSKADSIVLGDPCCLRQVYYGFINNDAVVTSSPKMFLDLYGLKLQMSALKQEFVSMTEYRESECVWLGDESFDDRLKRLLPNHFLDISKRDVFRVPIDILQLVPVAETIEYTVTVLRNSMDAISRRYPVIQALTAGWDSRVLLAASKHIRDKIQYYVFDHSPDGRGSFDVLIPQRLSAKLDFGLEIIRPAKLRDDFLAVYHAEHVIPRIVLETPDIQYHYDHYKDRRMIRICGFGGEIARCRFGHTDRPITEDMLRYFGVYGGRSEYQNQVIGSWLIEAREYADYYNIPLLDLFYWEQKMANWGALYPFEQDIILEEFCPFYNKNMLLSMLRVNPKRRRLPEAHFFRDLIASMWKEALQEPINPMGVIGYCSMLIGRDSLRRYLKLRAQDVISKHRIARS